MLELKFQHKNGSVDCNYFKIITDKNIYYSNKVVNCLWENKTKIDNYILDEKYYDTNYRYKFGIISKKINELNNEYSITFVNGPYGDFENSALLTDQNKRLKNVENSL